MTKRPQTAPIPPLLPLEYCRPKRAAELLHCHVEDLYHWAAIGAIHLYVMAQKAERPSQIYVKKQQYLAHLVRSKTLKFGASFVVTDFTEGGSDDWCSGKAVLSGFWAIRRRHIELWEEDGVFTPRDGDIFELSANFSDNTSPIWADVRFPNIEDHLWLMREDLELLQRHISSGLPLPLNGDSHEQTTMAEIAAAAAGELKPRITANQSRAIVELLIARGYTDDDFRGSIEALQQKLSREGLGGTLTAIDKNTLTAWLERAGVRW